MWKESTILKLLARSGSTLLGKKMKRGTWTNASRVNAQLCDDGTGYDATNLHIVFLALGRITLLLDDACMGSA
jgi:hypothetical protein